MAENTGMKFKKFRLKNKQRSKKQSKPVKAILIVAVALGSVYFVLAYASKPQICVVDQGDVVCVDDNLQIVKRHEFPSVNRAAKAISAAPNRGFFIVDPDTQLRDDPLDLYDKDMNYVGTLNLPVARYDMQKIQWSSDGSKAYILSDIGVLHELDVATKQARQLTEDRGKMKRNEDFRQNRRGFIVDYYLLDNTRIVLTTQNTNTLKDSSDGLSGPFNDTRLFVMNVDGSQIRRLGSSNRIVHMQPATKNSVLFSVNPNAVCEWGDECKQLYSVDVNEGKELIVADKNLEFRNFTYDKKTKTLFLTRGPGGNVFEVYYGKLKNFSGHARKIKLAQGSNDATQGDRSLIPLDRASLAIVTGYDGSGSIDKFDLKSGQRVASIDNPALKFEGVESIVQNWK